MKNYSWSMTVGLFSLVSVAILVGIFLAISDDVKFDNELVNGTVKNIATESNYFVFFLDSSIT